MPKTGPRPCPEPSNESRFSGQEAMQGQALNAEETDMEALLIKIPEAAAQLGVSRAKLYELIASGALPSVKVDGCRRVRTENLRAYVEGLPSRR